ncbi:MAG: type I methionyl aminopeptidase [Clostridiales bacterium]|nr:type I methionyl aminopeptidase [Clostridiales bacterium]MDY2873317.1 type I methionyl aminopeptidase [Eubacteriales bacterium]
MITIKSAEEIGKMRKAGALLHEVLDQLKTMIEPGVTTAHLDQEAERLIRDAGAIPSFKGYEGFPASICASVNDEVVHGFPTDKPLKEGSIVSIDCGLILDGWQSDSAFTAPVGKIDEEIARLIRVTEECFWLGAKQVREGNRLGDVSHAVQEHAEKNGYGVIRDLCGHGIGREMHEDPNVPNFGPAGRGVRLKPGMVIAIEPMIARGRWPIYVDDNGWTVITRDHSWCSHYEHTVAVTTGEPEILSYPGADVRRF